MTLVMPPGLHGEVPGLFGKPAQLRLDQEPQEGFRTFAVHPPSVPWTLEGRPQVVGYL